MYKIHGDLEKSQYNLTLAITATIRGNSLEPIP